MATRKKDQLPETFGSPEVAGEFWDTHSLADFEDQTKSVEIDFQITKRTRYISIPENIYKRLTVQANRKHRSVRELVFELAK
jgi:cupin superfamily acireductone dioxygenase involved in methionine salvage